jgi:DegV family protein with EDD domain
MPIGENMQEIAIISDTDSSLPFEIAARNNIYQVPMTVNFGEQSYEAVYAINDADTFRRIDKEGKLPTTAAPAPGKFVNAYKNAFEGGASKIVCICVSKEVSATYNAAVTASKEFADREITVIDSRSLSMGLGYMVLAAAEAAAQGASIPEIIQLVDDIRSRTFLYAALSIAF